MADDAFDLSKTFVHLGLHRTMIELPDFSWSAEYMREYMKEHAADGPEARLVGIVPLDATWRHWERHIGGDELVLQLSGSSDVIQDVAGELHRSTLTAGACIINKRGVWHTTDVHEPGQTLFVGITGRTLYKARDRADAATP
jgi:hypothetical protein